MGKLISSYNHLFSDCKSSHVSPLCLSASSDSDSILPETYSLMQDTNEI